MLPKMPAYDTAKQSQSWIPKSWTETAGDSGKLFGSLNSLRKNYDSGNYTGSWFDLMESRRLADKQNLSSTISPLFKSYGNGASFAWDAAGWANKGLGTPQAFSQTLGAAAPGLLRGVGKTFGLPGLVGLYGLASGSRDVLQDAGKIMPWLPKFGSADIIDEATRYASL